MAESVANATLQNAAGAIGPGQPMPIAGLKTVAFTLSGTFAATVTFECTTVEINPQPGDWFPLNVHQSGTTNNGTPTATVPGIYRASIAGLAWVRARVSSWTSGAVTILGKAVAVEDTSKVTAATITGSTLTEAQALPTKMIGGAAIADYNAAIAVPVKDSGGTERPLAVAQYAYGPTALERWRNNTEGPLLTSLARTATLNSPNQTNYNAKGVQVILTVTAVPAAPGAGGLIVKICGVTPTTGSLYALNGDPPTITAVGTYVYEVCPGSTTAGTAQNLTVNQRTAGMVPRTWLARINHLDAQGYTYSVDYVSNV